MTEYGGEIIRIAKSRRIGDLLEPLPQIAAVEVDHEAFCMGPSTMRV